MTQVSFTVEMGFSGADGGPDGKRRRASEENQDVSVKQHTKRDLRSPPALAHIYQDHV